MGIVQGLQVVADRTESFHREYDDGIVYRRRNFSLQNADFRQWWVQSIYGRQAGPGKRFKRTTTHRETVSLII